LQQMQQRIDGISIGADSNFTAVPARNDAAPPPPLETPDDAVRVAEGPVPPVASSSFTPVFHRTPSPGNFRPMSDVGVVAERLRRLIRRAELGGSGGSSAGFVPLEAAFAHFDAASSGYIRAADLRAGLRGLGESFHFSLEECRDLLLHLADYDPGVESRGMSLLKFYKAMGRKSPPPSPLTGPTDISQTNPDLLRRRNLELMESPVVHAEDAASRLRSMILSADNRNATVPPGDAGGGGTDPVEAFFRALDSDGSGYITADMFHGGLRTMSAGSESFARMDESDCVELVAMLSSRDRVSLIDFYRFMGRRSPPPTLGGVGGSDAGADEDTADSGAGGG